MRSRHEISNLVSLYAEIVDNGAFDVAGNLLADGSLECFVDGTSNGGLVIGSEAIAAWYRSTVLLHEGSPRTRHVITNLIIEVSSDDTTAEARSYFMVLQGLPGFPLQVIAAGRYRDTFQKIEGIWRFAGKQIFAEFVGDLSRHYPPLSERGDAMPIDKVPMVGS